MAKIHSKNTKFERDFVELLKKSTRRNFQTNVASIKGKPDIVFYKDKVCIFLDSDFWHGWQYPRWEKILNEFWKQKIGGNRTRDRKITAYLRRNGWCVIRIWEHNIKKSLIRTIETVVSGLNEKF